MVVACVSTPRDQDGDYGVGFEVDLQSDAGSREDDHRDQHQRDGDPVEERRQQRPRLLVRTACTLRRGTIGVRDERGARGQDEQRGLPIERLEYLRLGVLRDGGVMCQVLFPRLVRVSCAGLICLLAAGLEGAGGG